MRFQTSFLQRAMKRAAWPAAIAALLALQPAVATAQPAGGVRAQIDAVLQQSARNWNAGDLDAFMSSYENSTQTTSISGQKIVYGIAAIKAGYVRHYGKRVSGHLTFTNLTVRPLGPDYALAIARFHLAMTDGTHPTGPFSLILHHHADRGWLIILDH
jgi:uncharacterized protein (TIGR02246 family)